MVVPMGCRTFKLVGFICQCVSWYDGGFNPNPDVEESFDAGRTEPMNECWDPEKELVDLETYYYKWS